MKLATFDAEAQPYAWQINLHSSFHGALHVLAELCSESFQEPRFAGLRERGWRDIYAVKDMGKDKTSRAWVLLRRAILQAEQRRPSTMNHMSKLNLNAHEAYTPSPPESVREMPRTRSPPSSQPAPSPYNPRMDRPRFGIPMISVPSMHGMNGNSDVNMDVDIDVVG